MFLLMIDDYHLIDDMMILGMPQPLQFILLYSFLTYLLTYLLMIFYLDAKKNICFHLTQVVHREFQINVPKP